MDELKKLLDKIDPRIYQLLIAVITIVAIVGSYLYPVQGGGLNPFQPFLEEPTPAVEPTTSAPVPQGIVTTTTFTDLTISGAANLGWNAISPATGSTLTPTYSVYKIDTSAAITMTLGTTGAVSGQLLILYGDDNYTVTINDTNLLSTTGNALSVGQYDVAVFIFNGSKWVEWLLAADS